MERLSIDKTIETLRSVYNSDMEKLTYGQEFLQKIGYTKEILESSAKRNSQLAEWLEELKSYRDAEEQGLLLRLPCKVGSTVYTVKYYFDCKFDYNCPLGYAEGKNNCDKGLSCEHEYKKFFVGEKIFDASMTDDFGKTIFLTKEEAEQALAEMKGE